MTASRLVSVVIPAYNAERFVGNAVRSVLDQTHPDIECIVVDDGSTDTTARVAADCGSEVRILTQANRGVAAARNRGAAEARGPLLSFLDADDVWLPQRTERMLERLDEQPASDAVVSAIEVVDVDLRSISVQRQAPILDVRSILLGEAALVSTSSSLLIRKVAFEEIGGFDERLSTAADWDLSLKLADRGRLGVVDEPLTLYRRHPANMSRSISLMEHDMRLVYDEVFADPEREADLQALRRRAYARLHRVLAGSYFATSGWFGFARNAALSVAHHPAELGYFMRFPFRRRPHREAVIDAPARGGTTP